MFTVGHLGLPRFIGRFNRVEATLDFVPSNIAASRLDAVVETASVDVNNPDFEASLTRTFWLNRARFPKARFQTRSVDRIGADSLTINGDLSFLGVTHPLALHGTFNRGAVNPVTGRDTIGFQAHGCLRRSGFGLDNDVPAIGEEVELELHAECLRM